MMIRAGAYVARVQAPVNVLVDLARVLVDFDIDDDGRDAESAVVEPEGASTWRVRAGTRVYARDVATADVPDEFVKMLLLASRDAEPTTLFLHASAMALGSSVVVLAGASGAGKTTLLTAGLRAGWSYHADEMVALPVHSPRIAPYRKPISLVAGSFGWFPELHPEITGYGHASPSVWQIPGSSIALHGDRIDGASAHPLPELVVWLERDGRSRPRVEEMSAIEMAAALIVDSQTMYRPVSPANVVSVVEMCARAHCVRMCSGSVGRSLQQLEHLVGRTPPKVVEVVSIVSAAADARSSTGMASPSTIVEMAPGWTGVGAVGEALLFEHASGRLLQVDGATFVWLQLFDSRTQLGDLASEVADANGVSSSAVIRMAVDVANELARLGCLQW